VVLVILDPALTLRQRKRAERLERQRANALRARQAAEAKELAEEARAEDIAPSVRRKPVLRPDGSVYRHATLEAAGAVFIHSNPIKHLVARGSKRVEAGEEPTIGLHHLAAAERLQAAWNIAGEVITAGVSSYGDPRGGDGSGAHAMVLRQIASSAQVAGAAAWLGALWPVVREVALRGIDVTAWARSVGMDRKVALGFLRAALDRLVEFYAVPERESVMRTVEFSSKGE
jgi:hypothetical protein